MPEYEVEHNPLTEDDDVIEADLDQESDVAALTVPISRPPLVVDHDLEVKVRPGNTNS